MLSITSIQAVCHTIPIVSLVLILLIPITTPRLGFAADIESLQKRITELERQIVELRNRLDRLEKSAASRQLGSPSKAKAAGTAQSDDEVFIRKINDTVFSGQQSCKVGFKNEISGVFTKSSSKAYVIVKPLNGDPNWYVQPPAPVVHIGDGKEWTGKAFLGTPSEGVGDTFSVFVVITNENYKALTFPCLCRGCQPRRGTL